MIDLNVINSYLVIGVVLGCCGIGYVIKTSFDFIPNKYIPFIMAVLGICVLCAIICLFSILFWLNNHNKANEILARYNQEIPL